MRRVLPNAVLLAAALVATPGCGGSGNTVWVTGKLVKGEKIYVPPQGEVVSITFVGLETQDASGKTVTGSEPFWAEVDGDTGRFSLPGPDGRGIPPGKYRVAVTQKKTRQAFDATKKIPRKRLDRETDTLANRFGLDTSPILREVKTGGDFVIDLDNPTR